MNKQSNYKMLGLSPGCSEEDIKKAYFELAKRYHPDKVQQQPKNTDDKRTFVEIHKAYEEMTEDIRNKKNKNTKKLNDYMNYVHTIIDIFNENSSNSEEKIDDEYFKNQQASLQKACHKILKVMPHASGVYRRLSSNQCSQSQVDEDDQSQEVSSVKYDLPIAPTQKIPSECEIYNMVKRKRKIFKVYTMPRKWRLNRC